MTIAVENLVRRVGSTAAVDGLSFTAKPGRVTRFLGPNGAGKSTTMRCIVGLDRFDEGSATVDGVDHSTVAAPMSAIGAMLDASYAHPGRRARDHLLFMAQSAGIGRKRVDEVLELVGLGARRGRESEPCRWGCGDVSDWRGRYWETPANIVLDEPANGLDPEGIRWIRDFLQWLASQGRTVFVSSHQLSEIALMADDLVVVGHGRLIDESTADACVKLHQGDARSVLVESPDIDRLVDLLGTHGAATTLVPDAPLQPKRAIASM